MEIRKDPFSKSRPLITSDPVEPTGLAYQPDASLVAENGSVFHLSKEHQSIFRWSPILEIYTQSIPLSATPNFISYSSTDDVIYLSYDNGLITVVDPDSGLEYEFIRLKGEILAMSMLDRQLFVLSNEGTQDVQYVINHDGNILSEGFTTFRSDEYVWNQTLGKLCYVTNNIIPDQLMCLSIDDNGNLGETLVAENENANTVIAPVISNVTSDSLVLGNGAIYDASSLELTSSLGTEITDAVWYTEDRLLTLTQTEETVIIREWNASAELIKEIIIETEFADLVAGTNDTTYLLWLNQGMPQLTLWNFTSGDSDNDGVIDSNDAFPIDATESADNDHDGIGNNQDPDDDNDGVGDNADPDDDNDGINEDDDAFPLVAEEDSSEENDNSVTITDNDFDATPLLTFGVIASSYEDNRWYTLPAPRAIDGDLATRWGSEFVEVAWITIDLGVEQAINRVVLNWEVAYGQIYDIQVSSDFTDWRTVAKVSDGNGEIDNLEFNETPARYVRMLGKQRGTRWGYSLWEFRVFAPE